jgi:damage-control phosphatase, subfamily III
VSRWSTYISNGTFSLSVSTGTPLGGGAGSALAEFWTSPYPYWDMQSRDPELWIELEKSDLVVFKVCSNFPLLEL